MIIIGTAWVKSLIPQVLSVLPQLGQSASMIAIMLVGILVMLSAVGVRVSHNLGATLLAGIFHAVGWTVRTIVQALAWIITGLFRVIPRLHHWTRETLQQAGISPLVSNLLATAVTLLFVAAVI